MITNKEKMLASIKKWICDYAEINNKKTLIIINDFSAGFNLINKICCSQTKFKIEISPPECVQSKFFITTTYCAENTNGIIVSLLNKSKYNIIRYYPKYGSSQGDIYPLIDLYESDIANLLDIAFDSFVPYFSNITYNDIEWAQEENKKYGIIENDELPQHTSTWFKYTLSQKEIISKLHQREKQTRHKIIAGRPMLKF